jgi:hypothetical protein
MDIILLVVTLVSLVVAFVMSMAAWRLTREEKERSAARVAALSLAASSAPATTESDGVQGLSGNVLVEVRAEKPVAKAPWSAPKIVPAPIAATAAPADIPLYEARVEPVRVAEPSHFRLGLGEQASVSHASGFLGAADVERDSGGRQKSLAFAAILLFVVLSGGLVWMMSGPRGTTAVAVGPNAPLELVSLSHQRQNEKLAVSGLVRNPVSGQPVERLSAVVFLFDRVGTFVTSSRANVDFLKLGAGDETPFVVSIDAPATVARYRVSFRTDEGVVPHIDRRGASPTPAEGEQPVNVTLK